MTTVLSDIDEARIEAENSDWNGTSGRRKSLWALYLDWSIETKLGAINLINVIFGVLLVFVNWISLGMIENAVLQTGSSESNILGIVASAKTAVIVILVLVIIWSVVALTRIKYDISLGLKRITPMLWDIIDGRTDTDIPYLDRKDELGQIARSIEVFRRASIKLQNMRMEQVSSIEREQQVREAQALNLQEIADKLENTISDVVGGVAAASAQLQSTATSMASSAESSSIQSSSVDRAMDDASKGVTAAAAASDEFAMSIGEISRQAASSAELARQATDAAHQADATISDLSASAEEVGQVVELIQSIAQRTNLLALNASIEAARGGEAGRGFAVVASEVKELASQTSKATQKVASQIHTMQESTTASVQALRSIGTQIQQLETTSVSIATAVDQQAVAGQDLARSIDIAARGADEASINIGKVHENSLATGSAADQVLSSATDLEQQAGTLNEQVDKFLLQIRGMS